MDMESKRERDRERKGGRGRVDYCQIAKMESA